MLASNKIEILALIPARSGSKGIPDKNVRMMGNKPLVAHSIEHALKCPLITRTILSTDSPQYAEIGRRFGAETPFLRPEELAGDLSTDLECFKHALLWLDENEGYRPDILVHLRPTYPLRPAGLIDEMIETLIANPQLDSVRSVAKAPETPYKMWHRNEDGRLSPVCSSKHKDHYNMPRQLLPEVYLQNACVDVVRSSVILKKGSMTGDNIFGYLMEENFDIDTEEQLATALSALEKDKAISESDGSKSFCFDIDGVIASIRPDLDYAKAGPKNEIISLINRLYDSGHKIALLTARGSLTGKDWSEITRRQMKDWGVKHHSLEFGKPAADFYVDDKNVLLQDLETLVNKLTPQDGEK